jgi:hypothetical protein
MYQCVTLPIKLGRLWGMKSSFLFAAYWIKVSFWKMDKYQKLLVNTPSSMVQCIMEDTNNLQTIVKFKLGSVENQWVLNNLLNIIRIPVT